MPSGRRVSSSCRIAPPVSLATTVRSVRPSEAIRSAIASATPTGESAERSATGVRCEPSGSVGDRQRRSPSRAITGSHTVWSTSAPCRKRTGGPSAPVSNRSIREPYPAHMQPLPQWAAVKRVLILGSTGSIGTQALDVISRARDAFEVVGLSAGRDHRQLIAQARLHGVRKIAVSDPDAAAQAAELWTRGEVLRGPEGLISLVAESGADLVLNAIVGSAGLAPPIVALTEGIDVALANKESLVVGGELVTALAEATGAQLLPIDSEHTAMHPLLTGEPPGVVERLRITAPGGPFRGFSREALAGVTVEQALKHPTWSMGGKITIDSATLMNKGLELMEAHHLFGTPYDRIDVVVHPQSIIHALVQLCDGSTKAHMGYPDMRGAIGYALHPPDRADLPIEPLDLIKLGRMDFEAPDLEAFPCLRLAREAAVAGGTAPCALNAANEVAVHAFLTGRLGFTRIPRVIEGVLEHLGSHRVHDFEALYVTDSEARQIASELIEEVHA